MPPLKFGDLVEDVRKLIAAEYLDKFSAIMFSLTNKFYFNLKRSKLQKWEFEDVLRRGVLGHPKLFVFLVLDLHWIPKELQGKFWADTVLEPSIIKCDIELLNSMELNLKS